MMFGVSTVPKVGSKPRFRGFVARHAIAQLLLWSSFYYLLPAILPLMAEETGWSAVALSVAISAGFFLWAILSPVAGHVVDRGRATVSMRLAAVLGAGLLTVAATASHIWIASGALVLLGAAMAMTLYDPCFSVMVRRYGAKAGQAITTVTLIAGFATLLTFPAVAALGALELGWRGTLVVFALAALLGGAILPRDETSSPRFSKPALSPAASGTGRVLMIGVAFALIMFGHGLLLFQLPAQLLREGSQEQILMLPMVLGPAQIAGRLVWELALQTRVQLETAALGLFALMLLPPLILFLDASPVFALGALLLQGAGYGVHTILRPLLAAQWLPAEGFARRLGVIAMIGLLMMAAAPTAGAWIAAEHGFAGVLTLVMTACLAGLGVLLGLVATSKQRGWT